MGDLTRWVGDNLIQLVGYSQGAVVAYIIAVAKKASSPDEFFTKLVEDGGLSSSSETKEFALQLFSRVPHKASEPNVYEQRQRAAAPLARKQATYSIIEDDDGDDASLVTNPSRKGGKRFRKRTRPDDGADDSEEEVRSVRRRSSEDESDHGSESSSSSLEEERLRARDQNERRKLEEHMKERDAANTRKLNEQKLSRKEEEEAIRRSRALQNDETEIIRKLSRQEYLKKREQRKIELLRDDIEDEEMLFKGVQLTDAEYRELKHKKEVYELIKKGSNDHEDVNEYRMPDAYDGEGGVNQERRFVALAKRYRDDHTNGSERMNPFSEQEAWEAHQMVKATWKNENQSSDDQNYKFVFEDQVEFVKVHGVGDVDQDQAECSEKSYGS